ncbi:hypothetical protein [Sphingomonas hengshuiensis]|uniref:hypothetical protein n=1 Tax=Sphingomonas hengshuiensis TaxID=1609977 RepID=UPI0006964555|nr:hypothetical protein [Sphingomonas hengshuiensis]
MAALTCVQPAVAQPWPPETQAAPRAQVEFSGQVASNDTQRLANWVAASGDHRGLPFVIIDKAGAMVFVFDAQAKIRGAAPALLGLARADDEVAGIGARALATIKPAERTTPAGRFEAALGHDLKQDLLWIDYDAALSMHRVIAGKPSDRRHARLASPTPLDNRISYGCINVPARFYDSVIMPLFKGTVGIVYILPETRPIEAVFAMGEPRAPAGRIP